MLRWGFDRVGPRPANEVHAAPHHGARAAASSASAAPTRALPHPAPPGAAVGGMRPGAQCQSRPPAASGSAAAPAPPPAPLLAAFLRNPYNDAVP